MGLLIQNFFFDFYKVAQKLNGPDDFRKILRAPEARQCGGSLKISGLSVPFYGMLGFGAQKTFKTVTFFTCTSAPGGRGCAKNPAAPRGAWLRQKSCRAPGGVAAPKILPRPGGRGCAKSPADRKFTLSSRFAFQLPPFLEKCTKAERFLRFS